MVRLSTSLLAAPLLASAVSAATIEQWWNISYATANPDGVSGLVAELVVVLGRGS
jgi:hypothetical protein